MTLAAAPGEGFKKALIYRAERQIVRELNRAGSPARAMILAAPLQDGTGREKETYEGHIRNCGLVAVFLMHHMDIITLIVGRSHEDEHFGVLVRTIADHLPLSQRTVERCLRTLHSIGWLRSKTRTEKQADGSYIGRTAIRYFSLGFFHLLGLAKRLARRRADEYKERQETKKAQAPRHQFRESVMRELGSIGRAFVESRPVRAVRSLGEGLRPPDPEPAG